MRSNNGSFECRGRWPHSEQRTAYIAAERLSAGAECGVRFGGFDVPELRTLLTGLVFGESPRWHDDRLWCVDMGAHEVIAVDLDGNRRIIISPPTGPSAIDWLPGGRMLIAPFIGERGITRSQYQYRRTCKLISATP